MRKNLLSVLLTFLMCFSSVSAQWQKIDDNFHDTSFNIGLNSKIAVNHPYVFYYEAKSHRYNEDGSNPIDISNDLPDFRTFLYSFDGKLYAYNYEGLHTSADGGITWNLLSRPAVSDNGQLVSIVNDGDIFYGITNRKSILKSTDEGATWTETLIDIDYVSLNNLAVKDDIFFGTIPSGMWISKDAGQTWVKSNPSDSHPMWGAYNYDGTIIGLNSNNGIYIYDFNSDTWIPSSTGIESDGADFWARSLTSYGNTLFLMGINHSSHEVSLYTSTDRGASWTPMSMENLPMERNQASAWNPVVPGDNYLYYTFYGSAGHEDNGLYATTHSAITSIKEQNDLPLGFRLEQNYPNPFNPSTTIKYTVSTDIAHGEKRSVNTMLKIYNFLGQQVATLVDEQKAPGSYEVQFYASKLSSGTYFYKLEVEGKFSSVKKMMLLK